MFLFIVSLAAGLILLAFGGDLFVEESVEIARRARLPRIVIGGTIVSIATTSPEMIVSITAAIKHEPALAVGNAVGSAITNLAFIIGFIALFKSISIDPKSVKSRMAMMLGTSVLLFLFTLGGGLSRMQGVLMALSGILYLIFDFIDHRKTTRVHRGEAQINEAVSLDRGSNLRVGLRFMAGFILVIIGSRLSVFGAVHIARALGIPTMIIGLTMIAVGTSLPELITAIHAARKNVADLAVGNLMGANIMNITLITGTSAMICPLEKVKSLTRIFSFPFLVLYIGILWIIIHRSGRLNRRHGFLLTGLYLLYLALLTAFGVHGG